MGTQLLKVVAEPSGKQLVPGGLVSIAAKPNNTFQVFIENSGQLPVTKVEVRFIESGHVQKQQIKIIDPGGVAHVIFTPKYVTPGVPTTITVRSVPVARRDRHVQQRGDIQGGVLPVVVVGTLQRRWTSATPPR